MIDLAFNGDIYQEPFSSTSDSEDGLEVYSPTNIKNDKISLINNNGYISFNENLENKNSQIDLIHSKENALIASSSEDSSDNSYESSSNDSEEELDHFLKNFTPKVDVFNDPSPVGIFLQNYRNDLKSHFTSYPLPNLNDSTYLTFIDPNVLQFKVKPTQKNLKMKLTEKGQNLMSSSSYTRQNQLFDISQSSLSMAQSDALSWAKASKYVPQKKTQAWSFVPKISNERLKEVNPDLYNGLKLLSNRRHLMDKTFYRSADADQVPDRFFVATAVHDASTTTISLDPKHGSLADKKKKVSLATALLKDPDMLAATQRMLFREQAQAEEAKWMKKTIKLKRGLRAQAKKELSMQRRDIKEKLKKRSATEKVAKRRKHVANFKKKKN